MMTRPDLEKHAYQKFLQNREEDAEESKKTDICMSDLFDLTFPIHRQSQNVSLEYCKLDIRFCSNDGKEVHFSEAGEDILFLDRITSKTPIEYAEQCELLVTLGQVIWGDDAEEGELDERKIKVINELGLDERKIKVINEQDVIFGPLPRMTVNGTFIHNGIEKWYGGEGLATQRMDKLYGQAFYEVERAINAKLRRFVGETMLPFDFIETWPLENGTGEFLDELIPVVKH